MLSGFMRRAVLLPFLASVWVLASSCGDSEGGGEGALICEDTNSSCPQIQNCPDKGTATCSCAPAQEGTRCRYSIARDDADCNGNVICTNGKWVDDGTVVEETGW